MNERRVFTSVGMLIAILALAVGLTQAQALDPQSPAAQQAAVGNAFTYQGQLSDGGSPANGTYDFQFILYNALSGGGQVGSIVLKDDVTVLDGIFTVNLDFGEVFDGTGLWLEAAVRAGSSTGAYTILSPRQEITPAPYAMYTLQAYRANGLSAPDGDPMDAATVNNDGTLIVSDLEVVEDDWATLDIRTSAVDKDAHIRLYDDSDYWGIHNDDSEGNNLNIRYNNSSKVWITPDGDMGIGANAPSAKLDVAGDIAQDLAANGVVKAGAYITFTATGGSVPLEDCDIARAFTTVEGGAVSTPIGTLFCIVDFDFDLSQRYWVAMATDSGLTATCDLGSYTTRLRCRLHDVDSLTSGNFMLLVY